MFKVGDKVRVEAEGTVRKVYSDGQVELMGLTHDSFGAIVDPAFCTLIEPPLKVGDWVRGENGGVVRQILAIVGNGAWVRSESGVNSIWELSDLTRIEKP